MSYEHGYAIGKEFRDNNPWFCATPEHIQNVDVIMACFAAKKLDVSKENLERVANSLREKGLLYEL